MTISTFSGTVGHHEKGFGVEKLDVSHDGSLIASISHDECVKFWSIKYLEVIYFVFFFYKVMPGISNKMFFIWTGKVMGISVSSGLTFFDAFLKLSKSRVTISKKSGSNF